jgi:hypothetical protein
MSALLASTKAGYQHEDLAVKEHEMIPAAAKGKRRPP